MYNIVNIDKKSSNIQTTQFTKEKDIWSIIMEKPQDNTFMKIKYSDRTKVNTFRQTAIGSDCRAAVIPWGGAVTGTKIGSVMAGWIVGAGALT